MQVIAYAEFKQIREKLEDPAFHGWFLPFAANSTAPRCDSSGHCSDLFHTPSQRPPGMPDCGAYAYSFCAPSRASLLSGRLPHVIAYPIN